LEYRLIFADVDFAQSGWFPATGSSVMIIQR
jgi:hypothetical protein